jgi:hypothetical protein
MRVLSHGISDRTFEAMNSLAGVAKKTSCVSKEVSFAGEGEV